MKTKKLENKSGHVFSLLNEEENKKYLVALSKLERFEKVFKAILSNQYRLKNNSILIVGSHGIGKTYNITKWIKELLHDEVVKSAEVLGGRISPASLFEYLRINKQPGQVLFLDDADVLKEENSLNILKMAVDTKSPGDPRMVTWSSQGNMDTFEYSGILVMTSNEPYWLNTNPHVKAVVNRTHLLKMDFSIEDIFYLILKITEKSINEWYEKKWMTEFQINTFLKFIKEDLYEFHANKIFPLVNLTFDNRLIQKFSELFMILGEDWKSSSIEYNMLKSKLDYMKSQDLIGFEKPSELEDKNTTVEEAKSLGWKRDKNGEWWKPIE